MLVVSRICAGGYGTEVARKRSARGAERVVGRCASGAAVGVAEEVSGRGAWRSDSFLTLLSPQSNPYCS